MQWLNDNVYFGCAATRSTWGDGTSFGSGLAPWFMNDDYKHLYQGFIPVEDILDGLFNWSFIEAPLAVRIPTDDADAADLHDEHGNMFIEVVDDRRKAIVRSDTHDVLGVFGKETYEVHDYKRWLIENVASLFDTSTSDLGISSAGLLRRGGQAWVSIELPDDIEVEGAGHIRPCIIAASSGDGTLSSTYATRIMRPECDNSLHMSLASRGDGGTIKIKHSSKSIGRLVDARATLGLIHKVADEAIAWFDMLADVDVTDAKFAQIVKGMVAMPDPVVAKGKVTNQRSINNAERKRDELWTMWHDDPRAAPWNGTLAGAFHAVNTWQQHMVSRDTNPVSRMMTGTVSGAFDKADAEFWSVIEGLDIVVPVGAA
jgi:phage/plasmid-like protein (TIGR03299 family)